MLIPPDEHVLLLAERLLKLLSGLGRAQATLTAYRSALRHYLLFCSQHRIEPEKARSEGLAAFISLQLTGMYFPATSRLCPGPFNRRCREYASRIPAYSLPIKAP